MFFFFFYKKLKLTGTPNRRKLCADVISAVLHFVETFITTGTPNFLIDG